MKRSAPPDVSFEAVAAPKGGEATALRAAFRLIEKLAAGALPGND